MLKNASLSPAVAKHPDRWNLRNLPPEGHEDVGGFFMRLLEDAIAERDRLMLPERWHTNHALYRISSIENNIQALVVNGKAKTSRLSLGLVSANINKTVATITAKAPSVDIESDDGVQDDAATFMKGRMAKWLSDEYTVETLYESVLNMEIYGITVEKIVYDAIAKRAKIVVLDPFAFLIAPGNYRRLDDAPYVIHVQAMPIEDIEAMYGVSGVVQADDIYSVLGEAREENFGGIHVSALQGTAAYAGNYGPTQPRASDDTLRIRRALVVEVWIRDHSLVPDEMRVSEGGDPALPALPGAPATPPPGMAQPGVPGGADAPAPDSVLDGDGTSPVAPGYRLKYPGGIRVVTFTNYGHLVLNDCPNPNVNLAHTVEQAQATYLFDHFPFSKANAYTDNTSIWGFSMAEACGDINRSIDKLWSNIMYYLNMALFPPLILPKDTKIPLSRIRYAPRLVLEPVSSATAGGIRWLELPSPPQHLFEALDVLVKFFDRISQMDDTAAALNNGVVAASAVELLQERASVTIQAKIRAVDSLIKRRGRCAMSHYMNFGVEEDAQDVNGTVVMMRGVDLAGRQFNYKVLPGSTIQRSEMQTRNDATQMFQMKAIDRQAYLETMRFPKWQDVCERMGETELDAALGILVQAGLPQQLAMMLQQMLGQAQGGPNGGADPNAFMQMFGASTQQLMMSGGTDPSSPGQGPDGAPSPSSGPSGGAASKKGGAGGAVGAVGSPAGAPAAPGVPKYRQGVQ